MKKCFKLFAALCLAAVLCVPLAACEWGSESGGSENGGSENGGNSGDPSAVRTTVTEEEWNAAVYGDLVYLGIDGFLYDPEANVTIVSAMSMTGENGEVEKHRIEVQIDGNKRYYKLNMEQTIGAESEELTGEIYVEFLERPNDEGPVIANVYSKDENGQWTVERQESTLGTDDESIDISPYEQVLAYENFTYNASLRRYEAKDFEFDLGEESGTSLIIDFMTFQFENGKLVHCEAKIESEANGIETSVYAVWQYENGRVVRWEQQSEQKTDESLLATTVSATCSYGTASVTLPVVGE